MGQRWHRTNRRIFIFYGKFNEILELGTGFCVHTTNMAAVKRVQFVSDGMSYIILRDRWCDIIALNVHAAVEDKICDIKQCFLTAGPRTGTEPCHQLHWSLVL
jgi:hypothetical protein